MAHDHETAGSSPAPAIILGSEMKMKLVIDKIGISGDYSRTIVDLNNISMLTLEGSGENEELLITFDDGSFKAYITNDNQFGLPDGHGGIACASLQEVMNAYLENETQQGGLNVRKQL